MPCAVFDRCLSDFAMLVFTGFAVVLSAVWCQPVSGKVIHGLGLVTASAVFGFHENSSVKIVMLFVQARWKTSWACGVTVPSLTQ